MKAYTLTVRGRWRVWAFDIQARPEHVEEWLADGLVVDELVNTAPECVVSAGMLWVWCLVQDVLRFFGLWG